MIAATDQFPGVHVVIRTAGLARFVPFEMSLAALQVPVQTTMSRLITSNLAGSVNEVIRATSMPFMWVIDDDHEFDPQLLLRLLACDRPVVNGITCMNKPPYHTVIYKGEIEVGEEKFPEGHQERVDEIIAKLTGVLPTADYDIRASIEHMIRLGMRHKNKKFLTYAWKELDDKEGVIDVFGCGLSGMLIRTDVFKQLDDPWFVLGKTNPEEVGEDLYFCEKLRAKGIPIAIDLGSPFGHIAPASSWPARMNDGAWTIRVKWENGQNIVVNRGDRPPLESGGGVAPRVNAEDVKEEAAGNKIVLRTHELVLGGMSEAEAFAQAMRETSPVTA